MPIRADQQLVRLGLAQTRSLAQRFIAAQVVWRVSESGDPSVLVSKSGELVEDHCKLLVVDRTEDKFVSRSGLKLEAALNQLKLSVSGQIVLDIGQSTGGFTDCLLQEGASLVVGVDVGHSQLHDKLRSDSRVLALERLNFRDELATDVVTDAMVQFGQTRRQFDTVVMDVSFISIRLLIANAVKLLKPKGLLIVLFKPQFEVGKGLVGGGGVVRDQAVIDNALQTFKEWLGSIGLVQSGTDVTAPISGGDGNQEYLLAIKRQVKVTNQR